jgi:hypothetical protein
LKIAARSSLADVAIAVGDTLRRAGIRAVLTGGACAHLYSAGEYASIDADFILGESYPIAELDRSMATLGFRRHRDRYVHPATRLFVELPAGPLGIGEDFAIRPVWKVRRKARALVLSATDSCRDRLAAFYHWNDRQALAAAVAIAVHHRISIARVRAWSADESHLEGFEVFVAEVARARAERRARSRAGRRSPRT